MLRVETMALVRNYIEGKCNKKGQQKMNLTASEARGLRSLKTRVKEGEITVLETMMFKNGPIIIRQDPMVIPMYKGMMEFIFSARQENISSQEAFSRF